MNGAGVRSHLLYASSCLSTVPGSDHSPGSHNLQVDLHASLGRRITGEHWSEWQTDATLTLISAYADITFSIPLMSSREYYQNKKVELEKVLHP